MTDPSHDEHHEAHGSTGLYLGVFAALCGLTMLSFLTYFDWWRQAVPSEMSRLVMMAVSCTKAMLVIMFFMHLKWEANWKWVLTVPASIVSALLIFALVPDVGLRMRHASHERMIYAAERPVDVEESHDPDGQGDHTDPSHAPESEAARPAA